MHEKRREPHAHWLLLGLFLLLLLGELVLYGFTAHVGAAGSGPPSAAQAAGAAPAAVTGGGPVQRVAADGSVSTRTMPARTLALTFDDGPDPRWTPQILAVLSQYHAHATFFEVGSRVWLMLPGRERANAVVKWTAGDKIGAEFAEPISLEGLDL